MGYISQQEKRINRLEMVRTQRDVRHIRPSQNPAMQDHSEPVKALPRTFKSHTQFFSAADNPPFNEHRSWEHHGTFESEVDEDPLVRVLYRWTVPRPDDGRQAPSSTDIDILELRIASRPVVDFLRREVGYDFSQNNVIHFAKPFRTLIRNLCSLKKECDRLVEHR